MLILHYVNIFNIIKSRHIQLRKEEENESRTKNKTERKLREKKKGTLKIKRVTVIVVYILCNVGLYGIKVF